jgi:hypothetical protein
MFHLNPVPGSLPSVGSLLHFVPVLALACTFSPRQTELPRRDTSVKYPCVG